MSLGHLQAGLSSFEVLGEIKPQLECMHRSLANRLLTVLDAVASRHPLDAPCLDDRLVPFGVLVLKGATHDIGDRLDALMRVQRKRTSDETILAQEQERRGIWLHRRQDAFAFQDGCIRRDRWNLALAYPKHASCPSGWLQTLARHAADPPEFSARPRQSVGRCPNAAPGRTMWSFEYMNGQAWQKNRYKTSRPASGTGPEPGSFEKPESWRVGINSMSSYRQGTGPSKPPARGTVTGLIQFLARPHMHTIIFHVGALADRPQRYGQILEATGVPRNTLTNRLHELVEAGLFARTEHEENPPRVEYEPQQKMLDMIPMFKEMHAWADRYSLDAS